jgi:hypothetical protein
LALASAGRVAAAGDVVWQALLSLVLMNPKKSKGGKKVRPASGARHTRLISDMNSKLLAVWTVSGDQQCSHCGSSVVPERSRAGWVMLPLANCSHDAALVQQH